jgi:hypothetical protein
MALHVGFARAADQSVEEQREAARAAKVARPSEDALLPGEWREWEKVGLGFGLVLGAGTGVHVFGDYNLRSNLQVHVDYQSVSQVETNVLGGTLIETTRHVATGALRYFPSETSGWFIGGGAGLGSTSQKYFQGGDTNSSATFVPVFFDGGWQGWDGYYFTISVQLGGAIPLSTQDNTNNIPTDFDHQSVAKRDFDNSQSANGLMLGFGWYLSPPGPAPTPKQ